MSYNPQGEAGQYYAGTPQQGAYYPSPQQQGGAPQYYQPAYVICQNI